MRYAIATVLAIAAIGLSLIPQPQQRLARAVQERRPQVPCSACLDEHFNLEATIVLR